MKIAYLITAYNNPRHLNRLLEALNNASVDFYIHIDKKSKVTFDIPQWKNIHVLENNIEVFWGSFTFIEATILLIKEAKKYGEYDYYCMTSGADYPVRSNEYILNFFKKNKGKEFINICKMPDNDKSFDRVNYFYYSDFLLKLNPIYLYKILVNRLVRFFNIQRSIPMEYKKLVLFGGSNWWALSDKCVSYILAFVEKNKKLSQFYKNTYIPEEMFIHTIIGNSPFYKKVTNAYMYTDWNAKSGPLPAQIKKRHIDELSKNQLISTYGDGKMTVLFARKFADNSLEVLKIIDKELRQ